MPSLSPLSSLDMDHDTFLGICPPTPPLSQLLQLGYAYFYFDCRWGMTANRFLIVNKIENEFDQLIVDDLQKATDSPLRLLSEGKDLPSSLENREWNRNFKLSKIVQ